MAKMQAISMLGRVPLPVGRAGFKPHQKLNKSTGFSQTAIDIADHKSITYRRFGKPFEGAWRLLNTPLATRRLLVIAVVVPAAMLGGALVLVVLQLVAAAATALRAAAL